MAAARRISQTGQKRSRQPTDFLLENLAQGQSWSHKYMFNQDLKYRCSLIGAIVVLVLYHLVIRGTARWTSIPRLEDSPLVFAMKGARDEIAGIEGKAEEELEALRRTADMAETVLEVRRRG
jgi:hypothetical protein